MKNDTITIKPEYNIWYNDIAAGIIKHNKKLKKYYYDIDDHMYYSHELTSDFLRHVADELDKINGNIKS